MSEEVPDVEIEGLGKRYGKRWALRSVNMSFSSGEVVGFIGPNGAGKTTLIRLISGLSRPTEGKIRVLGHDLTRTVVTPDGIGLVVEHPTFIPYLSSYKNLALLASIRRVAGDDEIKAALRAVGLDPEDRRPLRAFSLGMRQRLGLAQALMEKPRLLLLDEPTNGLDPAGIVELRGLLRDLAKEGTAIFMASHLLTEVEHVCDRVLLVRDGQVVKELSREQIETPRLRVTVSTNTDLRSLLGWAHGAGVKVEPVDSRQGAPSLAVDVLVSWPTPRVVRELEEHGINIEELTKTRRSLEQEFMELLGAARS